MPLQNHPTTLATVGQHLDNAGKAKSRKPEDQREHLLDQLLEAYQQLEDLAFAAEETAEAAESKGIKHPPRTVSAIHQTWTLHNSINGTCHLLWQMPPEWDQHTRKQSLTYLEQVFRNIARHQQELKALQQECT